MTTKTDPITRLDALRAELGSLGDETAQARRSGDTEAWMALLNRAEALPEEIAEAEVAALRHRLATAWQTVDAASTAEQNASRAADVKQSAVEEHAGGAGRLRLHPESPEWAERTATAARLRAAFDEARMVEADATFAVDTALHEVCVIEDELFRLTLEEPVDGDGLRARPRPLTGNVPLPTVPEHQRRVRQPREMMFVGTRPPRWLAHRLNESLFAEPLPRGTSEQERELAAQAAATEDAFFDRFESRLRPGTKEWDHLQAGIKEDEARHQAHREANAEEIAARRTEQVQWRQRRLEMEEENRLIRQGAIRQASAQLDDSRGLDDPRGDAA